MTLLRNSGTVGGSINSSFMMNDFPSAGDNSVVFALIELLFVYQDLLLAGGLKYIMFAAHNNFTG